MIPRRKELNDKFKSILGSNNVYFQPPESIKLKYPCIIYNLDSADIQFSDNSSYTIARRYDVTLMDKNPDNDFILRMLQELPMIRFNRFFTADGINHYNYTLYF